MPNDREQILFDRAGSMPDDRLTVKLAARASLDRLCEAMNRINAHLGYLPPPDEPKGGA